MLNPEFAQAQLRDCQIENWRELRIAELLKLPKNLKAIGCGLFGFDVNQSEIDPTRELGVENYQQDFDLKIQSFQQLNSLNPQNSLKIFQILFPHYADIIAETWHGFNRFTYSVGYDRRAFRDPICADTTYSKRTYWLELVIETVQGYDRDLIWLARWCPYLGFYGDNLGYLFATAIDRGDALGNQLFELLIASAKGEDEIGAMGRHVVRSLLLANRVEGWELIENLLIAAQRQEGLRQVIFDAIDEAHPLAFQRMLVLISRENLSRFTSLLRAIAIWFGFHIDYLNRKQADAILQQMLLLLSQEALQAEALTSEDPQTVYLGLWAIAYRDVTRALEVARSLLAHPLASHRFVVVWLLGQLNLDRARFVLFDALTDADLSVAGLAVDLLSRPSESLLAMVPGDAFERLEAIVPRFPVKGRSLPPLVWDWLTLSPSQGDVVAIACDYLGRRPPQRLLSYLKSCKTAYAKTRIVRFLCSATPLDRQSQMALLRLAGDRNHDVREQVLQALATCTIDDQGRGELIPLLTRKSSDIRRGILRLLLKQTDEEAIATVQALFLAKNPLQWQAGLELLAGMTQARRAIETCQAVAQAYQRDRNDQLNEFEIRLLDRIRSVDPMFPNQEYTLQNALGLVEPTDLTPCQTPHSTHPVEINTPAAKQTLLSLDELIHQHRQTPVSIPNHQGDLEEQLLGNLNWNFPRFDSERSLDENLALFPLADLWEGWWQGERSRDIALNRYVRTLYYQ